MKIKGSAEIILTDHETGEVVQHVKEDNLITNGIAGFLKNHGMINTTPFTDEKFNNIEMWNDLVTNLFGGILLLDTAQTEDPDTTFVESGTKMIGNATYGLQHTGDPQELGSWDGDETGWIYNHDVRTNVYQFVYHWERQQGNGSIASICLTSRIHGFEGEGNTQSMKLLRNDNYNFDKLSGVPINIRDKSNNDIRPLYLDSEGNYWVILIANGANGPEGGYTSLWFMKTHLCNNILDFRDVMTNREIVKDNTSPSGTIQSHEGWDFKGVYPLGYHNITPYLSGLTVRVVNNIMHIAMPAQKRETETVNNNEVTKDYWGILLIDYDLTREQDTGITFCKTERIPITNPDNDERLNTQVWPYVFSDDGELLLINIAGTISRYNNHFFVATTESLKTPYGVGDVVGMTMEIPDAVTSIETINNNLTGMFPEHGKRHHLRYGLIWDEDLGATEYGRLLVTNCSREYSYGQRGAYTHAPACDDKTIAGCHDSQFHDTRFLRNHDYLATINNLEAPIVKDATQDMRVIYRLTFLDETEEEENG